MASARTQGRDEFTRAYKPKPGSRARGCEHAGECGSVRARQCGSERRRYVHRAFTAQPWPRDTCVTRAGALRS